MIQQTLFQNLELAPPPSRKVVETAKAKRYRLMNKSAEKAGKEFLDAFKKFFLDHLEKFGESTTEAVRNEYAKTELPQPHDWKASGYVVSELSKKGIIEGVKFVTSPTRRVKIEVFALVNR